LNVINNAQAIYNASTVPRAQNFTAEEDFIVVRAVLAASESSAHGTDRSGEAFFKAALVQYEYIRVHEYPTLPQRNQWTSLKTRWSRVRRKISRLTGQMSVFPILSGETNDDWYVRVKNHNDTDPKVRQKDGPFVEWDALKYVLEGSPRIAALMASENEREANADAGITVVNISERPQGRDKAKKELRKGHDEPTIVDAAEIIATKTSKAQEALHTMRQRESTMATLNQIISIEDSPRAKKKLKLFAKKVGADVMRHYELHCKVPAGDVLVADEEDQNASASGEDSM